MALIEGGFAYPQKISYNVAKRNKNNMKRLVEIYDKDSYLAAMTNIISRNDKREPQTLTLQIPIKAPKLGLLRRMFNSVGLFKLKPQYETLPKPSEIVMDAFRQHGFSDAEIAKLVQKIKAAGINEDEEIIQIANGIPLPLQIKESVLKRPK